MKPINRAPVCCCCIVWHPFSTRLYCLNFFNTRLYCLNFSTRLYCLKLLPFFLKSSFDAKSRDIKFDKSIIYAKSWWYAHHFYFFQFSRFFESQSLTRQGLDTLKILQIPKFVMHRIRHKNYTKKCGLCYPEGKAIRTTGF